MDLPGLIDWGNIDEDDIRLQSTFDEFFGKSFSEAIAMFEYNALFYYEDLIPMPTVPFNFYAPAFVAYITSEAARGDAAGASCFLTMVLWMFETRSEIIFPETKRQFLDTAKAISSNQDFFCDKVALSVYGRFTDRALEIEKLADTST